ncbi:MAG: hypothetical protein FJX23_04430 [Alphaproteobacteria bacterium]|nr:hypothetical protein [Alphaproteobacteria bacterium]
MDDKKKEHLEASYEQVVSLYDAADALIASVKAAPEDSQEAQYRMVAPLVEQLESSADILTEEYIHLAENDSGVPCARSRKVVESTLRKTVTAIDAFFKSAAENHRAELNGIFGAVLPLVQSAKQQLFKAIGAFSQLIDLSLGRILSKTDVERLKAEEPKVAAMLDRVAKENSQGRN